MPSGVVQLSVIPTDFFLMFLSYYSPIDRCRHYCRCQSTCPAPSPLLPSSLLDPTSSCSSLSQGDLTKTIDIEVEGEMAILKITG